MRGGELHWSIFPDIADVKGEGMSEDEERSGLSKGIDDTMS